MISRIHTSEEKLADLVFDAVTRDGACIVEGVLDSEFIEKTRHEMYRVSDAILSTLGPERLERAGERGVQRLMMKWSDHFFEFLRIPSVLAIADRFLGNTCVMHLQNGFILPPAKADAKNVFQYRFHRDFPRLLNGFLCSLNMLFAIDDFREDNGSTLVVPGTHQRPVEMKQEEFLERSVMATCKAGSIIVFDSTVIHAAGENHSKENRLAINHQFTRSYFKQQLDYVRALSGKVEKLDERTKQLLGWYTRLPTSLEEYYVAPEDRLYRGGQG